MRIHHNLIQPKIVIRWLDLRKEKLIPKNGDESPVLTFFRRQYSAWSKQWEYNLSIKTDIFSKIQVLCKKPQCSD